MAWQGWEVRCWYRASCGSSSQGLALSDCRSRSHDCPCACPLPLAALRRYGIPEHLISLDVTAGSVVVHVRITTTPALECVSCEESIDFLGAVNATTVKSRLAAVNDTALATALGVPASRANTSTREDNVTTSRVVQVEEQLPCERGQWCTGGTSVKCPRGTYNPMQNAFDQRACLACPENSLTSYEGATEASACECDSTFQPFTTNGTRSCLCPQGWGVIRAGGKQSCAPAAHAVACSRLSTLHPAHARIPSQP